MRLVQPNPINYIFVYNSKIPNKIVSVSLTET